MPFIGQQPVTGAYHKLDAITTSATATYNLLLNGGAYSPASANHLLVSLNGVIQAPQDSFTVSGSTIIFDSALTSSDNIDFIMALGDVLSVGVPTDGSVNTSQLANSAVTDAKMASTLDLSGKTVTYGLTDSDMPAGSVLQVIHHTIDPGSQSTTSGTLVETGLPINITPTATSSKMLILACMHECYVGTAQKAIGLAIAKGGTRLYDTDNATIGYSSSSSNYFNVNLHGMDTPNTSSAITYSVMARSIYPPQTVAWNGDNTPSFLTVMEIAK